MQRKKSVLSKIRDKVKIVRLSTHEKVVTGKVTEGLPSPDTRHWIPRRKAQIVKAIQTGFLSQGEACVRYSLSREELRAWIDRFYYYGLEGLSATHAQAFRSAAAGHH